MQIIDTIRIALDNPKRALSALLYRTTKSFWNHKDYKKFIVLSRSRTGSNMLIMMLKSHPKIYAKGEIFQTLDKRDIDKVLTDIFGIQPKFIKAVGFKIFYYHQQNTKLWDILRNMNNLHVIHLKRRNILRTLTSLKIATQQDAWLQNNYSRTIDVKSKMIEFTFEELTEGFVKTQKWEQEYEKKFSEHKLINLYYEDIVKNSDKEFAKITDLMELKFYSPQTYTKKQNPESLSNLISNYQSLKKQFSDTRWSHFFED